VPIACSTFTDAVDAASLAVDADPEPLPDPLADAESGAAGPPHEVAARARPVSRMGSRDDRDAGMQELREKEGRGGRW
jgi:hypothetical protein